MSAKKQETKSAEKKGGFGHRAAATAAALGVAIGALSASAAEGPPFCDMVRAFDQALQVRYYQANLAPNHLECNFYKPDGCSYSLGLPVTIRVTHLEPIGCDDAGQCSFRARQTCEADAFGANCGTIMAMRQSDYVVSGQFSGEPGALRLTEWVREPSALVDEAAVVSEVCPQLL